VKVNLAPVAGAGHGRVVPAGDVHSSAVQQTVTPIVTCATRRLMTATPAGVKLHAELSALLGAGARAALHATASLARALGPATADAVFGALVAAGCVLGVVGLLAAAHDAVALAALPLVWAHAVVAALYRAHLSAAGTTWAMMRGRPWRPAWPRMLMRRMRLQAQQGQEQAQQGQGQGGRQERPSSPRVLTLRRATTRAQQAQQAQQEQQEQLEQLEQQQAQGQGPRLRRGRGQEEQAPNGQQQTQEQQQQQPTQGQQRGTGKAQGHELWGSPSGSAQPVVAMEQLLVGALLFVPLLLLLPTVAAWYLATSVLCGTAAAARACLLAARRACGLTPPLLLLWRVARPGAFPSGELVVEAVVGVETEEEKAGAEGAEETGQQGGGPEGRGGARRRTGGRGRGDDCAPDSGQGDPQFYRALSPVPLPLPQLAAYCWVHVVGRGAGGVRGLGAAAWCWLRGGCLRAGAHARSA
jgi:hypothetical protein